MSIEIHVRHSPDITKHGGVAEGTCKVLHILCVLYYLQVLQLLLQRPRATRQATHVPMCTLVNFPIAIPDQRINDRHPRSRWKTR